MGYNYEQKLKAPVICGFTAFLTQFFRNGGSNIRYLNMERIFLEGEYEPKESLVCDRRDIRTARWKRQRKKVHC